MSYLTFKPHLLLCGFVAFMVLFLPISTCTNNVFAQSMSSSDERDRGIALFRQGEHARAITDLKKVVKEDKRDYEAWHFLGLAQIQIDDLKNATKTLPTARIRKSINVGIVESMIPSLTLRVLIHCRAGFNLSTPCFKMH